MMMDKGAAMQHQPFFDTLETITLYDELSQFLGAIDDGIITYSYFDIVKTAGHSCGTVAGAYIMALHGLKALYPDDIPKRGEIKVAFKKAVEDDNAGVMGCVLSNITGATTDYGFGGIPGGKFNRRTLLFYGADIATDLRLTRLDTMESVGVNYHPKEVVNPMKILMSAIGPDATQEDKESFGERFQNMVKTLFENQDKVVEVIRK